MAKKRKKHEKRKVEKLGIFSFAKIGGLFGIIYGLIAGILLTAIVQLTKNTSQGAEQITQQFGTISSIGSLSLIIFPIIYGAMYFIVAAVTAFIYNFLAKQVGGIEITLK